MMNNTVSLPQNIQCEMRMTELSMSPGNKENLPAQGQHDKSLKSYPSLPAQLDSHSDTQSGLETVLDL